MSFSQVKGLSNQKGRGDGKFPFKVPPQKTRSLLFGEEVMIYEHVYAEDPKDGEYWDASIYKELESTRFL